MALASNKPTIGTTSFANKLRGDVISLQNVRDALTHDLATLELMKESGSVGTVMANLLGAATTDDAQAAYDEVNSLVAKIDTDASVTNVKAAINQAANKLR